MTEVDDSLLCFGSLVEVSLSPFCELPRKFNVNLF